MSYCGFCITELKDDLCPECDWGWDEKLTKREAEIFRKAVGEGREAFAMIDVEAYRKTQ